MLVLRNLRKRYGALTAIDDVSLELRRGEIFGLLGPNGAGKSTLVQFVAGLLDADEGEVFLDDFGGIGGGIIEGAAMRARMGFAPQQLALYPQLSGVENLNFFGGLYRLSGDLLATRVRQALAFVGLSDRKDDQVHTYSGGMARRLNLAAAILHAPDFLILDEPTVGVDPQSRNRLLDNIESLARDGTTILYTTHAMEEAERICHRVAIMDSGRILAVDTIGGLLDAHAGPPVLTVEIDGHTRTLPCDHPLDALNELSAHGETPTYFAVLRPNLEQVFLTLTGKELRDP